MKKTNRPTGQTTLFQTWHKQENKSKKQNSKSLFDKWETSTNTSAVSNTGHLDEPKNEECFDFTTIGDDDDDIDLLAAVEEIEQSVNDVKNNDVGNLSFTASSNDDGGTDVILGFDCTAGNSWIYPTNYPLREYQFNIVEKALFHNTLVTLPTGLGKTFIAAVVMYNFYRWYPQGKIIFMAPTKPLVAQQIDACYNIMGIPRQDTAEMTGNKSPAKREQLWKEKRVFFLTPQVFQNDLSRGSCHADDVVCLVFDEAHKALGNYSYCQVVREVLDYNKNFRVLALSATPGDGIKAVQQVITNLLVSHIELRSEDSADIKPYTHQRQVEKIVVKLGDNIEFFKTKFLRVLRVVISRLSNQEVLWMRDAERVSKCMLLSAREQFRKKLAAGQQPRNQSGAIEGDFAVAISLYHGYDLLLQHGLLPFYNFLKGIVDGSKGVSKARTALSRNVDFVGILHSLRDQIELPNQPGGSSDEYQVNPSFISHPKLLELKDIVLEHFRAGESVRAAGNTNGSRVMIFAQFRDSVQEISRMLSEHEPLVKAMSFIGQRSKGNSSKGLTQREQLQVIRKFRNGGYNTLVATCVGEEGLDIGEVDLIICFDASASPIRLVQRMGRTGRKRDGRIIVLVTEGKEEQVYQRSQRNKSSIHKVILESARTLELYLENPRMVPKNIKPVCQKMFITVAAKPATNTRKSAKCSKTRADCNIKKLLSASGRKGFLSPEELRYWNDNFKLPNHEAGLTPVKSSLAGQQHDNCLKGQQCPPSLSLTEWTAWQTPLQQVHFVDHSKRSRHFVEILEFCDFRREYNDNEDSYDLEMYSYLNREDVLRPGEIEVFGNPAKVKRKDVVVVDDDDGETTRREDGDNKTTRKEDGETTRREDGDNNTTESNKNKTGNKDGSKKRKSAVFFSDIDDDFEDSFVHVPEKTAKIDESSPRCEPPLETELEKISPTKTQLELSHSLAKNMTESANHLELNRPLSTDTRSENDLSDLFDIPSSQRHCNVNSKGQISYDAKSKSLLSKIIPDAPSLDTLLELSAISEGMELEDENDIQDRESDRDFFPTMFAEAPKANKDQTCKIEVEPGKRKSFDETVEDECDKKEVSEKGSNSKKSKNIEKDGMTGNDIAERNRERKAMDGVTSGDGVRNDFCSVGEKKDKILDKRLQRRAEEDRQEGPHVFGSGLVCDAVPGNKEDDGVDFDFDQELVHSFFDADDEMDRILCAVKTPGLSGDDERVKNLDNKKTKHTSNGKGTNKNSSTEKLGSGAKPDGTSKHQLQTPCVFDDDMFVNANERNRTGGQSNRGHKNIETLKYNLQTPQLFDDEEFESEENDQGTELRSTIKHLTYPDLNCELNNVDMSKPDCGESVDNQVTASKSRRKPLVEHNVDSKTTNELAKPKSQSSLSRIQSSSILKPTADQSKSQKNISKPHNDFVYSFHEYGHDVVASTPNRTSYFDKSRSFRMVPLSLKSFSYAGGGKNETTRLEARKNVLKLRSNDTGKDLRSNQTLQVDAEMLKKSSSVQDDSLNGRGEEKQKQTTRTERGKATSPSSNQTKSSIDVSIKGSENTENFCLQTKIDKQPTTLKNSSFTKTASPKIESQPPEKSEYADASRNSSFEEELMDEEMDLACLSACNESNSPLVRQEKGTVSLHDVERDDTNEEEILKEKTVFKSPPPAERKPSGRFEASGSNKTMSECQVEYLVDSQPVTKSKGNSRSKALNKLLDSDEECGDEASDNDGGSEEETQIKNGGDASVVCKQGSNRNLTKIVHKIPDSDEEEFDLPKKAKRKRESSLLGRSKVNKQKKRRPLVNDFLEVEAEVSEDEINISHGSSDDGGDLEEMEDSFIDDRSQLTQRSPLTAMKQKKTDKSGNMMDIYRASLLTPHRQQLRFQSPAFHRNKSRYKMVYQETTSTRNPITFQPDDDSYHDVSMETEESDDDTLVEEQDTACPSFVSPDESQITVRRKRRGTKRVLAESYFASPNAADSVDQTSLSDHKTKLSEHKTNLPEHKTKVSDHETTFSEHKTSLPEHKTKVSDHETTLSDHKTKISEQGLKPGKPSLYLRSRRSLCVELKDIKNSQNFGDTKDDAIFKRPVNTAPVSVNKGLCGIAKGTTGHPGDKEGIDDILAALNDTDDETLLREIDAISTTVKKNEVATKNASETALPNISKKTQDYSSSKPRISTDSRKPKRHSDPGSANTNMIHVKSNEISRNAHLSRSVQLYSSDACVSGTRHSSNSSKSTENKQKSRNSNNDQSRNSECSKINAEQHAGTRTMIQFNRSDVTENLRTGLNFQTSSKTMRTDANPHLNSSTTRSKNNTGNVKPNESYPGVVKNCSPIYQPLTTMSSSKDDTHVCPETTAGQESFSEHTILDASNATAISDAPSTSSNPALTPAQRDKNKLTILVGPTEVSNCQIVSFLRRKHNIKAIVSPVTGCDYIVSNRMAVERKSTSDISNQSNYKKLLARVRDLCDLYDRSCIVIERDRVKNGETQVKHEVRSKYFDRILACLSQAHVKVLFSEGQEGTADILASLAHAEERKGRAIIYPLPLNKEREQIVKFLSSIPRTSYITAIGLCYHYKNLQDIMNSSPEELIKRVKSLSEKRAKDIHSFFQHRFSADMVNCGGT